MLRFDIDGAYSIQDLDEYERVINDTVGEEFLTDFMGTVYRNVGVDYGRLEDKLRSLASVLKDEPLLASSRHRDWI